MTGALDMESLTFRPTEIRDIPSLYEVRAATRQNAISKAQLIEWGITPESTAQGLESQALCGMVCEAGGKVVGFCSGDATALSPKRGQVRAQDFLTIRRWLTA